MFSDDENPYIRAMKYTYTASALPNTRIDVADILRGIAIAGIVLLHFIEHLNFYAFPEPTRLDQAVWDSAFFIFGGNLPFGGKDRRIIACSACWIRRRSRPRAFSRAGGRRLPSRWKTTCAGWPR